MRCRGLFLAALLAFGLAAPQAADAGWSRRGPGGYGYGYGRAYDPGYARVYRQDFAPDRYAYQYSPRRYYPYYNSGYWRPASLLRYRKACCRPWPVLPRYYQAWGYPNPYYVRGYGNRRIYHW